MPRRTDLKSILLLGSGPIVIGQACEFDYSGTQGAKALRQEGYRVILVNSNPATIMTDPEFADRTYVEPLTPEVVEQILRREKPDAVLPTLGGQTALNLALEMESRGVLAELGIELLGARVDTIHKAEDRELFKALVEKLGLRCPRARTARTLEEAHEALKEVGFPVILRPSFTMGGSGGGVVYNREDFDSAILWAFQQSPTHECLVEESVLGWKEYELEVIRDSADNFSVICTIENIDPMGVHTGDSVTVAPAMTLTDKEYQRLRDASRRIITEVGVETGGANIQFGVNPDNGDFVVIEMNPRVSRSSALASKATGYPIAKIAAKLAVGYTLDELRNDMTGTSAAFEPTIDYVVVKAPRFAFEKFPGADPRLTTQMKSVGEAMSIGRTFSEAFQKAMRSLEIGRDGLDSLLDRVDYPRLAQQLRLKSVGTDESSPLSEIPLLATRPGTPGSVSAADPRAPGIHAKEISPDQVHPHQGVPLGELRRAIADIIQTPLAERLFYLADGFRVGLGIEEVHDRTKIDPWFLHHLRSIALKTNRGPTAEHNPQGETLFYKVDTCAGEFEAKTNYFYSTRSRGGTLGGPAAGNPVSEATVADDKPVMILGGGPNRIGQGIEFDYCCVHAAFACRELNIPSVMVNCNPETVSTDFDTSDRLYFEPLTFEDVMNIVAVEQPRGVIVQLGGQTPLKLAVQLAEAGVPILGTPADAIDRAEDRERFDALLEKLKLKRPPGNTATSVEQALQVTKDLGFPVVVRPSYVLGGRAMEIVHSGDDLMRFIQAAFDAVRGAASQTILVDRFLQDAIEVDVDCVCDGKQVVIGAIMQHIEEAGVHSGDSSLVLPAHTLSESLLDEIRESTRAMALELGVVGLMNVQYAVQGDDVYVIEVNPRASRTVPFVAKATGFPLARIAAKVMMGHSLESLGYTKEIIPTHVAVKESVFPFHKFAGVDTLLGPEMRSTGEVMGIDQNFPRAFMKAQLAASTALPEKGTVLLSVRDGDKPSICKVAQRLQEAGFSLVATRGTADALRQASIEVDVVNRVNEGRPHIVDMLRNDEIHMVINTTEGARAIEDSKSLRRQTLLSGVPYFTTAAAAEAAAQAMQEAQKGPIQVRSLQEFAATAG